MDITINDKENEKKIKIRESKRLCAQRRRDKLKQEFGTCLTEQQAIYNKNYQLTHHDQILAARRRSYAKKKAMRAGEIVPTN